jgi:hypothetical protein
MMAKTVNVAFEVINSSILSCLFSDILIFGYMETHNIFAIFMNSRCKRFANISENKTNPNKTSSAVLLLVWEATLMRICIEGPVELSEQTSSVILTDSKARQINFKL